ncbi:TPA: hypothetical protein ACN976_005214 [Vibrio campbellii]
MDKTIVQRYMNLPKFLYLLQNKALFLPKMSKFSDHLEGGMSASDYMETSNEPRIFDIAINNSLPVFGETARESEERRKVGSEMTRMLSERQFETPFGSYSCDHVSSIFPLCREWLYVSCWHKSTYECSAMWELYGSDNNSVCIFTTKEKLREFLTVESNAKEMLKFENVEYKAPSEAKMDGDCFKPFLTKALPFSFEKELRVVAFDKNRDLMANVKDAINSKQGIKLNITSLAGLIDRVVVSPNSDSWFKDSIQTLCDQYELNVVVADSELKRKRVESLYNAMKDIDM